ncbi:MAG: hypothetical protein NTZ05_09835 [Chloroflexi bacterium]|nr:hypothetical protein [Chloroflexota bacterium]
MNWDEFNRMGYLLEQALGLLTLTAAGLLTVLWVMPFVWDAMPRNARLGLACSTYIASRTGAAWSLPASQEALTATSALDRQCAGWMAQVGKANGVHVAAPGGAVSPAGS